MHIKITVKPNAREEKIQKTGEDEYLVMLNESPKHGRANARLLNLLTHFFLRNVRIVHGLTSRHKIVELS
jgi:uncharacterized protein (TIGR00251 family)